MAKNKRHQGMTLIEVVVSIAVYGLLALLLTEIMCCVNATMRATSELNKRLNYEAKYADNLQVGVKKNGDPFDATSGLNVSISYPGGTPITVDHAQEYTAAYPAEKDPSFATNYKFMVIQHNDFPPKEYPSTPFYVQLRIGSDVLRTKGTTKGIRITGGICAPATYTTGDITVNGSQVTVNTDPASIAKDGTGKVTKITNQAANFFIPYADLPGSGDVTLIIPVGQPTNAMMSASTDAGYGTLKVTIEKSFVGTISGTTYNFDGATVNMNYCTCFPVTKPDGTTELEYFPNASFVMNSDGTVTAS